MELLIKSTGLRSWVKQFGGLDKLPITTLVRVRGLVIWTFAIYNLIRIAGIGDWWQPSST